MQGDAISRSAVLEMLRDEFNSSKEYFELTTFEYRRALYLGKMNCSTRARRKVMELPALDVVPAEQGKWISVKDRLPQRWKRVLVAAGDFAVDVYEAYIDSKGEWMRFNSPIRANIGYPTYWIPLPEPPKEGSNEQHPDGL